ncbi:hypothetical protein QG37_07601 [Candidozyma auris]|nr:hypothetical protein QG37_07601 [[Candida] auris]
MAAGDAQIVDSLKSIVMKKSTLCSARTIRCVAVAREQILGCTLEQILGCESV